jgi:hypothetical protein
MALPASGPISGSQIGTELGVSSPYSLHNMSLSASFSTPDAMSDFYGYSGNSATLSWTYSVTGGPSSNSFGLRVNGSLVETRTSTSSGNYTVNVGDTIYVVISCNGCSGGSGVANAFCSGIIVDAACDGSSSTTLTSTTYTVVSGDVGNTLSLDSFAACDSGCL